MREKMSPAIFPIDLTALEDGEYDILFADGTTVSAAAPADIFDAALVRAGFNLIDRATWPVYHRALVLEQFPKNLKDAKLVRDAKQAKATEGGK
jgi:hypothetical protein